MRTNLINYQKTPFVSDFCKALNARGEYDVRLADIEEKITVWTIQKKLQRDALLSADKALKLKVYESIQEEEETYH